MGVHIAGAGCCLLDIIHSNVDFSTAAFKAASSRRDGDGGLTPGKLVFTENTERFTGSQFPELLAELVGPDSRPAENVGGPSVVSLIHAAQMLEGEAATTSVFGARGDDPQGRRLLALLRRMPVELEGYRVMEGRTPSTFVLSDPRWDNNHGERCFVNEIGAATHFGAREIGNGFDGADIVALGGTALVPALHTDLPEVLAAARTSGSLTVVNTVFDFQAERRNPDKPWPLGGSTTGKPGPQKSYGNCDLLIMDKDEALRLSGTRDLGAAMAVLMASGVGACAITRGAEPVVAWAAAPSDRRDASRNAGRFKPLAPSVFPVIDRVSARSACLRSGFRLAESGGDTTGCGDSFAGGILAALSLQLADGKDGALDLGEAVGWGIAGGAFTLGILGGCHFEQKPGEKRVAVEAIHAQWAGCGGSWDHGI